MRGSAVIWLFVASPALAGDIVQGANLLAMGGVGAAAPQDNAAVSMNPGLLGLQQRYDFHAHFRFGPASGMQWAASAVDARTSDVVTIGLAYSGDRFEPPLRIEELPGWALPGEEIGNLKRFHDFTGGLGVALLDRKLSLGFGGNVGMYQHDRQGSGVLWDLHAGLGIRPVEAFTLGFAVRDFVPVSDQDRPLNVLMGARGDSEVLSIEGNLGWTTDNAEDRSPLSFGAGLEKPLGEARLRVGGRYDGPDARPYVTAGIGYDTEGGAIEYGLAVPLVSGASLGATVHQVSVRFGAPADITPP